MSRPVFVPAISVADAIEWIERTDDQDVLKGVRDAVLARMRQLGEEANEELRAQAIVRAASLVGVGDRVKLKSYYQTLDGKMGTVVKVHYPERSLHASSATQVWAEIKLDGGRRKSPRTQVTADGNIRSMVTYQMAGVSGPKWMDMSEMEKIE